MTVVIKYLSLINMISVILHTATLSYFHFFIILSLHTTDTLSGAKSLHQIFHFVQNDRFLGHVL